MKANVDHVTLTSASRALMMGLGTGSEALAAVMMVFVAMGAVDCCRRIPRVTMFVGTALLTQAIAVAMSGALWISQPMVLARYLLIFVPFLLFVAAMGFRAFCSKVFGPIHAVGALSLVALLLVSCMLGPLPAALRYPNAFFSHQAFFGDFDESRNAILPFLRKGPMPTFYEQLGQRSPGELTLIEAPWRFESMFNRQPVFQATHRQHVRIGMLGGVCPPGSYGEHPRLFPNRFRNFVDMGWPDERIRAQGDYLVLHRKLELENMTEPWQSLDGKGLPPIEHCIEAFKERFGAPVFEDDVITVFSLQDRR